jgi:hypothetical protein
LNQLVAELQDELTAKIEEVEALTVSNNELKEEVDVFTEQVVNFEEVCSMNFTKLMNVYLFL